MTSGGFSVLKHHSAPHQLAGPVYPCKDSTFPGSPGYDVCQAAVRFNRCRLQTVAYHCCHTCTSHNKLPEMGPWRYENASRVVNTLDVLRFFTLCSWEGNKTLLTKKPANKILLTKKPANKILLTKKPAKKTLLTKKLANKTLLTKKPANKTLLTKKPANKTLLTKKPANKILLTKKPAKKTLLTKKLAMKTLLMKAAVGARVLRDLSDE
ncbi:hypothetical protein O3P69_012109 [Scylla paramamosain]|uniref:PLAC domain-containing protein n=1 Tax=Scylla paramamosain TaxID=85552 RepID=A0AAW0TC49_SCYPA